MARNTNNYITLPFLVRNLALHTAGLYCITQASAYLPYLSLASVPSVPRIPAILHRRTHISLHWILFGMHFPRLSLLFRRR